MNIASQKSVLINIVSELQQTTFCQFSKSFLCWNQWHIFWTQCSNILVVMITGLPA